jgi:hypothetical protein
LEKAQRILVEMHERLGKLRKSSDMIGMKMSHDHMTNVLGPNSNAG